MTDATVFVTGAVAVEAWCVTDATALVTGAVADELVPEPEEAEAAGAEAGAAADET